MQLTTSIDSSKTKIIILSLFLSLGASAQLKLGVDAGWLGSHVKEETFKGDAVNVQSFSPSGFELGFFGAYGFEGAWVSPKVEVHLRQFRASLDYDLSLSNVLLEVEEHNTFQSVDIALLASRASGNWELSAGPCLSFYRWSSTHQHYDLSFKEVTEYEGSLPNQIERYEPQQLVFLQGGAAYLFHQRLSVYANAYVPVINTKRQMATAAELEDDSGQTELYSEVSFSTFNFSLGLRYSIL